ILDCVKTLRIKLSMREVPVAYMSTEDQHLHKLLERFTDWKLIPKASQTEPGEVLLVLEKAGDFAAARAWATVHKLPQDILKDIEQRHLYHLLTLDQPDTVTAFQLLDKLRLVSKAQCLRLRDKLIADERLSLAMEVSTKCGIDPAGVWSAMGFACLHLGDFTGARDKFAHCLKVPADKNQTSASQSRLLGEILEFLDTIPSSGFTEVHSLLTDPGSICDITTLLIPSVGEENRIESCAYQECLYYLRTYGSYLDHICFLRQHSYWMKAAQFAGDYHCSSDIFVHGLMVPAMNSGEMSRLLEQMLMLDPTLEKWTAYLMATCKHLLKQKYFNTLYHVQLFMKDYIRAAMTCITHFYQRGATSYLDLSGRLQFLFTAQHHLEAYLDPGQWGSVRHPLAATTPVTAGKQPPHWDKQLPESSARMTLSREEVKKEIKVTKFLEQ
ncbi:unnamed protein product, partial [Candidula unifasciata]